MLRNFSVFLNSVSTQTLFTPKYSFTYTKEIYFSRQDLFFCLPLNKTQKSGGFPQIPMGQSRCRECHAMLQHLLSRWMSETCEYCDYCCIPRSWAQKLKSPCRTKVIFPSFEINRTILIISLPYQVHLFEH